MIEASDKAPTDDVSTEPLTQLTLKECLLSAECLLLCLWSGCNKLRHTMLLGGLNIWLYDVTGGDSSMSRYFVLIPENNDRLSIMIDLFISYKYHVLSNLIIFVILFLLIYHYNNYFMVWKQQKNIPENMVPCKSGF